MHETLRVLPNPFTFVDADGEPQGACPADPSHAAGKRMWVGARLDQQRTKFANHYADGLNARRGTADGSWAGDTRPRPQVTKFVFVAEPIQIPLTAHYLERIRVGELIAADEVTLRKARGLVAKYLPPNEAIALFRRRAFDEYQATYGKPPAFEREAVPIKDAPNEPRDSTEAPIITTSGEVEPVGGAPAETFAGDTP